MKELQNNFTTPEQSKKLLELGVPADSADMYYKQYSDAVVYVGEVGDVPQGKTFYMHEPSLRHIDPEGTYTLKDGERIDLSGNVDELRKTDIPCWSVGRLIEIYDMCFISPKSRSSWCTHTRVKGILFVDYILDCYKNAITDKLLDFSNLED